jgi:hypothetical protein
MALPAFRHPTGPAPDPNALVRKKPSDAASWIRLPERGLSEVPDWPLEALDPDFPVTMQQESLWRRVWTEYPQAHIWKRNHMEMLVVGYVRIAIECASGVGKTATFTTLRQYSGDLMLTQHALRAARIIIDGTIEEPIEEHTNRLGIAPVVNIDDAPSSPSVRDRLRGAASAVASGDEDDDDESEFDNGRDDEDD